jgi:hypothetical protein
LDFVMFGTGDLGHYGEKFKIVYHLHKPSYMPYLPCRKKNCQNFNSILPILLGRFWPFVGLPLST